MVTLFLPSINGKWSVGQGVKTPPFHGGITGSIPVRSTPKKPLTIDNQQLKAFLIDCPPAYLKQSHITFSRKRSNQKIYDRIIIDDKHSLLYSLPEHVLTTPIFGFRRQALVIKPYNIFA